MLALLRSWAGPLWRWRVPLIGVLLIAATLAFWINLYREYAVQPLALPIERGTWTFDQIAASEAVRLFVDRAEAVQTGFRLTPANAWDVAEICRRLDGLPLAIELAAARTKILSPSALLGRLSESFRILTEGPRDAPQRLQTMRAAVAWSYDLLSDSEQSLLRRLSIFPGGFGIDAAVAVHDPDDPADIFELVASLVDKSLLKLTTSVTSDARFVMLQTIQDFGLEELARHGIGLREAV